MVKRVSGVCEFCGRAYEGYGVRFCSPQCRNRHRNATDNPSKRPENIARLTERAKGNTWCVGRVLSEETRRKISESNRGKPGSRLGDKASDETREKIRQHMLGRYPGSLNHNWRGGSSPRDWSAERYRQFRRAVWARERGHCQSCGVKCTSGKQAHVHHIKSWIDAPELRYEPDNAMLLCVGCHDIRREGRPAKPESRAKMSAFAKSRPRDERGVFIKVPPS